MNIYLTVTDNFYMSMSIDSKAQQGEDITVHWDIPDGLGYRYRLDFENNHAKGHDYVTGLTQYTLQYPYNKRGFLGLQFVIDTETQGKRKTNMLWLHVNSSVAGDAKPNVILEELERLAFCEVQEDAETNELVFYSLSGDEVDRIKVTGSGGGGGGDLDEIIERLNILEELVQTNSEAIADAQATIDTYINQTDPRLVELESATNDLNERLDSLNTDSITTDHIPVSYTAESDTLTSHIAGIDDALPGAGWNYRTVTTRVGSLLDSLEVQFAWNKDMMIVNGYLNFRAGTVSNTNYFIRSSDFSLPENMRFAYAYLSAFCTTNQQAYGFGLQKTGASWALQSRTNMYFQEPSSVILNGVVILDRSAV